MLLPGINPKRFLQSINAANITQFKTLAALWGILNELH